MNFRIWDKKNNKYVGNVMGCSLLGECVVIGGLLQEIYNAPLERLNDYVVERGSGVKDHEGNEIYEGDIVLERTYNGSVATEVIFGFGCFYAGFHKGSSTKRQPKLIKEKQKKLGNIHFKTNYGN